MKEADRVARLMECWRAADDFCIRCLPSHGLQRSSFFVLYWLLKYPEGLEPARIAELALLKRQLTSGILRDFEERGYIRRREQQLDHRRKTIMLTRSGRTAAEKVCGDFASLIRQGLASMSESEQSQYLEYTERFFAAMTDNG